MNRRTATVVTAFCFLAVCAQAPGEELNLYEWSLVAPVVVSGTSLGENGKVVEVRVERVFRGTVKPGDILLVDQREANRERNRYVEAKSLRLDAGSGFALILDPAYRRGKDGPIVYSLARGVRGARPLPKEGAEAWLAALQRLTEIQSSGDENRIWHRMTALLEETDPRLLSVALQEFLKYRRGDPELLLTVFPLLDHPSPGIRDQATRLIGQITEYHRGEEIPQLLSVRAELIARARRDESAAVRKSAVESLGAFASPDVIDILEEISEDDPEQSVRYAAELTLIAMRKAGHEGRRYENSSD